MNDEKVKPFDLNRLSRHDLATRPSKVDISDFGKPVSKGMSFKEMLDALPDIQAAADLKHLAQAVALARREGRLVHLSMGAHVLKVGLAPLLIDLFSSGILTGLSVNGAVLIHDFETAAAGKTSEDVDESLVDGRFGMAQQTGQDISDFINKGSEDGLGLADSIGRGIAEGGYPHGDLSLLATAWKQGIPATAHPALGTDITHLWPDLDWASLGTAAQRDFLTFISLVEQLKGAVYLNVGSAVVMPEVFLKAVTAVRNAGTDHTGLITADFDFIRQYRPLTNVVKRPTASVGTGFSFTGHHEIMIPLLFAAVCEYLEKPGQETVE